MRENFLNLSYMIIRQKNKIKKKIEEINVANPEERHEKLKHNKEIYEKMTAAGSGINGENHIKHHVDRCNRG